MSRAIRFLPGHFQREIDYEQQIELSEDYQKKMEKEYKKKHQDLQDAIDEHVETNDEELLEDIEQQYEELENLKNIIKTNQEDLDILYRLRKETSKNKANPELFDLRITMMNVNFADTYSSKVCSSSYIDEVPDIDFVDNSPEYNTNISALYQCSNRKHPLFLKIGHPGHLFAVLIFFEERICEIWDTSEVSSSIKRFFLSMLPTYYTVICVNAQIQTMWCDKEEVNVYIVKKSSRKPIVNIYCQTWPFFFAYMRCVKKISLLDILKFLSCLSEEEKMKLIDRFNTELANNGQNIQYINEINDKKRFNSYVRSCDKLLDIGKSVTFASFGEYEEIDLSDEDKKFKNFLMKMIK